MITVTMKLTVRCYVTEPPSLLDASAIKVMALLIKVILTAPHRVLYKMMLDKYLFIDKSNTFLCVAGRVFSRGDKSNAPRGVHR
jgi:hypothetical protein